MSFSSEIKEELSKVNNFRDKKILEAEFLGYILTGNVVSNYEYIEFITENEFNIERFYKILFNLGIAMELPIGYESYITPRSSTFKKYGLILTNSIGVWKFK